MIKEIAECLLDAFNDSQSFIDADKHYKSKTIVPITWEVTEDDAYECEFCDADGNVDLVNFKNAIKNGIVQYAINYKGEGIDYTIAGVLLRDLLRDDEGDNHG